MSLNTMSQRLSGKTIVAAEIVKETGDGVKIFVYQLDVSKADDIDTFVASLPDEFKEVDILVNNA
jgi:3-hydroxy acid dehydrogenase/malonic semialdehyde reductase